LHAKQLKKGIQDAGGCVLKLVNNNKFQSKSMFASLDVIPFPAATHFPPICLLFRIALLLLLLLLEAQRSEAFV